MALNPSVEFPTKTAAPSAAYPLGAARNVTTPGDGTGTPWIASLINDIFGFQQALLDAAGIVASGDPDEVGASQYLEAIDTIIADAIDDAELLPRDGSLPMTGLLTINVASGDVIDAGNLIVITGAGGVGLHYGSPGVYGGGLEITPTGQATVRYSTGAGASLQASSTNVNLKHSDGVEVVRTLGAAAGGLQVNNTSTGAGFERVLTASDLSGAGFVPLNGSAPMTGLLTINVASGDVLDAGNMIVQTGAGGIGIYFGGPGSYNSGLIINSGSTGAVSLRQGTSGAGISCSSNVTSLTRDGGTAMARTMAAASGGFEVNNTLTGAGFERALTTSDLTTTFIRKAADESRNTTVALAADATLTLAVAASRHYAFSAFLKFTTGAGGARIGFNLPAGATIDYEVSYGTGTGATDVVRAFGYEVAGGSVDVPMPVANATNVVTVTGTVSTAGTAGNVVLTWAQETSDAANTTLESGSRMRLERYA